MENIDTLLHARWVIPVDSKNRYLEDHCIAIHEDKILEILPGKQAAEKYNIPRALAVDDLLADPEIEIVLNLTIPIAHFDVAAIIGRPREAVRHAGCRPCENDV